MISEVFQSDLGSTAPRPNGRASGVGQVQATSSVEVTKASNAADTEKVSDPSATPEGQNLQGMVENLNELAQSVIQRQLQFSIDEDSGKTVIKVIDTETDELIRQIPPEDLLEMQKYFGEMNGMLFESSA